MGRLAQDESLKPVQEVRVREIDRIEDFETWDGCVPTALQALDLRPYTERLVNLQCAGSLFLGCPMAPEAAGSLVEHGAWVVPDLDGRAFSVHRARLYAAEELYDRFDPDRPQTFSDCLDQRVFREYLAEGKQNPSSIQVSLARRLHDHSITDAMESLIDGRRVVAVMGGHAIERAEPIYAEIVRLAKGLAERNYLLSSGGGPGAMEATHLGAWLAGRPDGVVDEVLGGAFGVRPVGSASHREYADEDWLVRAWRVRERWPRFSDAISLGIPTWLYGHEPPTPFATHIAKFFANSVREDSVLAIATHGVIFAPGRAGTTQEIFQDACQNRYATSGSRSPMILLGEQYWTTERPVWPLLRKVSHGHRYGELVHLVDDGAAAIRVVQRYQPAWYRVSDDVDEALEIELRHGLKLRQNIRFPRVEHLPPEPALGAEAPARLAGWLEATLGDDWVNVAEAEVVWRRLLSAEGAPTVHLSGGVVGFRWPERLSAWTVALDD